MEERLATHDGLANIIQGTLATAIMTGTAPLPTSLEGQTCGPTSNNPPNVNALLFARYRYTI